MLIASHKGNLYKFENEELKIKFKYSDYLMGIDRKDDFFYLSSRNSLLKLNKNFKLIKTFESSKSLSFHHLIIIDDYIFVTVTDLNEIWIFDLNLIVIKKIKITPPNPNKAIKRSINYNHINGIHKYKNNYYITLSQINGPGYSGIAVLDEKFQEIDRFQYGWMSHAFKFINDKKFILCASNGLTNCPNKAGLLVDNDLKFIHSNNYFCKDFQVNNKNIVLVGAGVAERGLRKETTGIIYILDFNYILLKTYTFPNSGGIKGLLL